MRSNIEQLLVIPQNQRVWHARKSEHMLVLDRDMGLVEAYLLSVMDLAGKFGYGEMPRIDMS